MGLRGDWGMRVPELEMDCSVEKASIELPSKLGVWESAGLWVESDAPRLSSVSVPGSVASAH